MAAAARPRGDQGDGATAACPTAAATAAAAAAPAQAVGDAISVKLFQSASVWARCTLARDAVWRGHAPCYLILCVVRCKVQSDLGAHLGKKLIFQRFVFLTPRCYRRSTGRKSYILVGKMLAVRARSVLQGASPHPASAPLSLASVERTPRTRSHPCTLPVQGRSFVVLPRRCPSRQHQWPSPMRVTRPASGAASAASPFPPSPPTPLPPSAVPLPCPPVACLAHERARKHN